MEVRSFGCAGYKAFRDDIHVELRPLTLFFGRNNSGKSAILRVIRLILRALAPRRHSGFPLDVDGLAFGTSFRDLIHGGDANGRVDFRVSLADGQRVLNLEATVQNIVPGSAPAGMRATDYTVVSQCRTRGDLHLDLEWEPSPGIVVPYKGFGPIPFRGLLPNPHGSMQAVVNSAAISEWRDRVTLFEERIEHIGPVRTDVPSVCDLGPTGAIGFDGSGAIGRLARDNELLDRVSAWYREHMNGWALSLTSLAPAVELRVQRGGISVNLAQTGKGMQQALPIVVQQLGHQLAPQSAFFDLLEEPESHLHAGAHAALGDLLLDSAKLRTGQLLVETHSEDLLLRVRRRIAENADPSLVILYWIEDDARGFSTVRPIQIDEYGDVDWWPEGVFSQSYEEVRALRRAAHRRRQPPEAAE